MKRSKYLILPLILISTALFGQNIFPQIVEGCDIPSFCLDCGEPAANYDAASFAKALKELNSKFNFKGVKKQLQVQVLVDSTGKGCVISHTDTKNSSISKEIVKSLNRCKWIAAKEKGVPVSASTTILFEVVNGKLKGAIKRFNLNEETQKEKNVINPKIYNHKYPYKNTLLNKYDIQVWNTENSNLPNDAGIYSAIDQKGNLWYASYVGLTKFDGKDFINFSNDNSPLKGDESVRAVQVDKNNNIWFYANNALHKFDGKEWVKYDSTTVDIGSARSITGTEDGEVLCSGEKGLFIYSQGKWTVINKTILKELPSSRVLYSYKDKKERLWISTYAGTIMLDKNNKVVKFNDPAIPLNNNTTILRAAEDEAGNLYLSLMSLKKGDPSDSPEQGLAVYDEAGKWKHYNDQNSGLPANLINSLLYDKFEKILWIGTAESGLGRFDLKNGWESYHNLNSKVPSPYILDLSQDAKGNVYGSTFNGLMRIKVRD